MDTKQLINGKKMVLVEACAIDGCWLPIKNKSWCAKHVARWERHGHPPTVKNIFGDNTKRFWSKVDKNTDNGCWKWRGAMNIPGYGVFWNGRRMEMAHRWAFEHIKNISLGT